MNELFLLGPDLTVKGHNDASNSANRDDFGRCLLSLPLASVGATAEFANLGELAV
jgi:hypothetical protein